ncbi:hypothetical protein B0H12DRAFT_478410 [Mycena haematopus]|nr:hypothetical protein B0H12DRAFT_478410 [Mycena haematopus]
MSQPLLITGADAFIPGSVLPNRLEINSFVKQTAQFSLFVQALRAIYSDDQNNLTSYFQLAGIHGMPYAIWNESGATSMTPTSTFGGYCTHGTVLFPTWHRPYVALFEQIIQQRAAAIAQTYTVGALRDEYTKAAAALRLPYWDWAANIIPPPEIIDLATVEIVQPDGAEILVDNPFLAYAFNPIPPTFPTRGFNIWPQTLRYPNRTDATATSNVNRLKSNLQAYKLRSE